jgi:uncharacterized protein
MRITVFGAAGNVGSRVVDEALSRGHHVTAVVRDRARFDLLPAAADARTGDAGSVQDVVALSAGHDVVISATRPPPGREHDVVATTQTLLAGVAKTGVRLVIVGGAASLTVPDTEGARVLDDPALVPAADRDIGLASVEQLDALRADASVDWAYLSPAADMEPGERTGRYRLGTDELLVDANGNSRISLEDLAVALVDEAEQPRHHRARFTVSY